MNKGICFLLFMLLACAPVEKAPEPAMTPEPSMIPEPVKAPVIVKAPEIVKKPVPEIVQVSEVPEIHDDCPDFGCPPGGVVADMELKLFYDCSCQRPKWLKPERIWCFSSAEDAIANGYRRAESC